MADKRFLELLTARVRVYGIFDPNTLDVFDVDVEVDIPLTDIVGISYYNRGGKEIFVICARTDDEIVKSRDMDGHFDVYLVTNELTYDMILEFIC